MTEPITTADALKALRTLKEQTSNRDPLGCSKFCHTARAVLPGMVEYLIGQCERYGDKFILPHDYIASAIAPIVEWAHTKEWSR